MATNLVLGGNAFLVGMILLLSTSTATTCGWSTVTGDASLFIRSRILGSIDAIQNELPWQVHLDDSQAIFSRCGGVVIARRSILTAAHCVAQLVSRPDTLRVGYGAVKLTDLKYVYARNISVHPDFNSKNRDNDIAVITLNEALPLNYSPSIRSICLPDKSQTYEPDSCLIAGWGLTEAGGNQFPETLKWASVPTVPIKDCQRSYANFESIFVSNKQLCAGFNIEGGVDACLGDSGGPLICARGSEWVVYGIVSTGNRCGLPGFPGVYAYVPQHVSWIESQIY